jgi:hypothetical protein
MFMNYSQLLTTVSKIEETVVTLLFISPFLGLFLDLFRQIYLYFGQEPRSGW